MNLSTEARLKLYKRRDVRLVLSWTINGHEQLKPIWNGNGYSFPELSKLLGASDVVPLLDELVSNGLYERYIVDSEPACPECGLSSHVHHRYVCPFCQSRNLRKGVLIEHYRCGYIDFSEKFSRNGDLICPKCSTRLKLIGTDYRRIEDLFRCLNCGKDFSLPNFSCQCYSCSVTFTLEKARVHSIYGYKFNEQMRSEVTANCVIEAPLASLLREKGYEVETLKALKGSSGVEHIFDIVAAENGKHMVFAIASGAGEIGNEVVVSYFAKVFDIAPHRSFLIALMKLADEARKLAALYGLEVIEGESLEEVLKRLRPRLREVKREALQKETFEKPTPPELVATLTPQTGVLSEEPKPFSPEPPTPPFKKVAMEDIRKEFYELRENFRRKLIPAEEYLGQAKRLLAKLAKA